MGSLVRLLVNFHILKHKLEVYLKECISIVFLVLNVLTYLTSVLVLPPFKIVTLHVSGTTSYICLISTTQLLPCVG